VYSKINKDELLKQQKHRFVTVYNFSLSNLNKRGMQYRPRQLGFKLPYVVRVTWPIKNFKGCSAIISVTAKARVIKLVHV